jgi:hypothetical protein
MSQTLIGVIYDQKTLAPRRVVFPHADSHLDGRHAGKGEATAIISAASFGCTVIAGQYFLPPGKTSTDLAYHAVRLHTGREPPPLHEIQVADAAVRGMTGAR